MAPVPYRSMTWLLALLLSASFSPTGQGAEKPNIIFFLADDQRWDQMGCAGHPVIQTPNVDQLAREGVRFRNMFVTTSICAASRASIFTGHYERSHRYTFGTVPIAKQQTSLSYPALLKQNGYQTGFVGKFGVRVDRGVTDEMFHYFKPLGTNPYHKPQPDGSTRHVSQIAGDLAIEFLSQQVKDKPFCLSVSFNAPHAEDSDKQDHYPFPKAVAHLYEDSTIAPPRMAAPEIFESQPEFLKQGLNRQRYFWRWDTDEKYQKNIRGYYRMISGVDHVVGRVMKQLEAAGLSQNTILVYAGDNGYYLGQRGFAGKWSHYEESLRVPLVIHDPRAKVAARGKQVDPIALNIDIPATILELAGVEVPESYQGRGLGPLLAGDKPDDWRTDFLCEHLLHMPGGIPKYEGVRGERWVYARYFEQDPPFEFLHDLENDPDQLINHATDSKFASQLATMRSRCDQLRDQYGGEYSREKFPLRGDRKQSKVETDARRPTAAPASDRPNVILIISDDQAWTDFGFMGHPVIQTPSLDRLAQESATYLRGYVPTALCRPSLATMITGLYPHQHRITGNDPSPPQGVAGAALPKDPAFRQQRAQLIRNIDRVATIPKLLAEHGYLSHQSGKWWEGNFSRGGFTHGMTHGDPDRGGRHGDEGLKIGREGLKPVFDFIDEAGEQPYFLWYAPFLPHSPHNPPQRLLEKYQTPDRPIPLARYYAMCEWLDETCGQLLDYVDQKDQRDNTIVIFVVDNGWIQRTPQTQVPEGWRRSFAPRSKQSPFDGGTRTPIMIRWPQKVVPGLRQHLASSIDIAPTVLRACGLEPPAQMEGIDLVDQSSSKVPLRSHLLGEGYAHDIADLADPEKTLLYRWCIEENWKLLVTYDGKIGRNKSLHPQTASTELLFDLAADPHEHQDLAAEQPGVVKRLQQHLEKSWQLKTAAPLPVKQ